MKKMLVVVDMLNDFINPNGALYVSGAERIVDRVADIIKKHRAEGNVIIYLADNHKEDDVEFDRFPKHCVAGTEGAQIVQELNFGASKDEVYMPKTRYSGFFNTNLAGYLERVKPELVEVVGVCTSICVMDTVAGIANRDIKTRVYRDAIADLPPVAFHGIDMNEAALKRMEVIYGTEIV